MEKKELEIYKDKIAGRIILNRPEAYNALSFSMIQAIYQSLVNFEEDKSIALTIISSNSDKSFCAGGDIKWLYAIKNKKVQERLVFFMKEYRLNAYIAALKKPYVSIMNGLTMGGGVGIGLHGSHPVATESFVFAMPETAIGLFPDVGASYLLSRLPKGIGMYLALTGKSINAFTAYKLGLVKYIIPDASVQNCIQKLTHILPSKNLLNDIDACLQLLHENTENEFLPVDNIEKCFTKSSLKEIINALSNLDNEWAQQILKIFKTCSPMSLKVTFLQIQQAKHKDLVSCLAMDKQLVNHFVQGHDFYEGVRAMLIDKDKTPHWQPSTLEEVTDLDVELYFK